MNFIEDPRIKIGRRNLALAWIYYSLYLIASMVVSYTLTNKPYICGLPRWVALGCVVVPFIFVVVLIFIVEKFIPNVPLAGDEKSSDKE
jgi:uncharacterized membrane protein YhdT